MSDLISRLSDLRSQYNCFDESERDAYGTLSEAIKVLSAQPDLDEWCTDCKEYDQERHSCPRWNRVIRETLKDAQPERKTGKWILISDGYVDVCKCDQCGHNSVTEFDYCPHCGADMRGEEE